MSMLYVTLRILIAGCRLSGKAITILLIIFAIVEAGMGYSQLLLGTSLHHLYPVTGSFLNPGPYSAYLALGIVALCAFRKQDNLSQILITLLAIPLVLTRSRAAFLATFICLMILFYNKIKGWKQWGLFLTTTGFFAVCLYLFKSGSADGRLIINYLGIHCFSDNPLWGNGVGSFFNRYALKTAQISLQNTDTNLFSIDVIDYAFNDLLLVGVEQGGVGVAFLITLIIAVLHRLRMTYPPLFLSALELLIFSLFSYPFELLPYQIIGVILTSYAATNRKAAETNKRYSLLYALIKVTAVLTIILSTSFLCNNIVRERLVAEKEYRMFARLRDRAFIKDYYSLLYYLDDNKHFLFDFAKILSKQGRYNDSNDMLRRGALISNDPMFLVLQGNNYCNMEAYELAQKTYLQAWHTMPNRIYPLYQLMKLHEKTNNIDSAKSYAKKIINFKEKIHSPAVNDMKRKAQKIYQNEL